MIRSFLADIRDLRTSSRRAWETLIPFFEAMVRILGVRSAPRSAIITFSRDFDFIFRGALGSSDILKSMAKEDNGHKGNISSNTKIMRWYKLPCSTLHFIPFYSTMPHLNPLISPLYFSNTAPLCYLQTLQLIVYAYVCTVHDVMNFLGFL